MRWAILGDGSALYLPGFTLSLALVVGLLASGIWYFRRVEKGFSDVI
jgi:lipopolysaccharide transport system permease protein